MFIEDTSGKGAGPLVKGDGLEHEGKLWLVPMWKDELAKGTATPERIIRFDLLVYSKTKIPGIEYVLTTPIPKAVLDGHSRSVGGIEVEVVEHPQITVGIPPSAMH